MQPTLLPGATFTFQYVVPPDKTVPNLYPDAPEFVAMPGVFATGFMVGLMEWTCIQLMAPHLDEVRCVIDYPLDHPVVFEMELGTDIWEYDHVCNAIADQYVKIYSDPTAHAIWGHDIGHLVIEDLIYFEDENLIYPVVGS